MKVKLPRTGLVVFLLLAWGILSYGPGASPAAAAYYEGKTITMIVSSSPGGGTDATGRLFARFLPRYLPGNPRMIIQNMPGGVRANNYYFGTAKPDGLTLFQDSSSGLTSFVRGGSRIKYDPREYRAIASMSRGGSLIMLRKDAKDRFTDPKAKPVIVGDPDGIRTWLTVPVWGAEFLGWNLRFIYGYPGTGELMLALRQGEIEFFGTQSASLVRDVVKEGIVDVIAQQGEERRPDFPDVPTFLELLGEKKPKGPAWEASELWSGPTEIDKFLVVPAATPPEIVQTLREAAMKASKDPEFAKQATAFVGEVWHVRSGDWTEKKIREVTTVSPEADKYLANIRKKYGLPVK